MDYEFSLPSLGENIQSADVVSVHAKPGDLLKKDQPVLELETEKAVFELPAPVEGRVKEAFVKPGDKVKVGQVLMLLDAEAGAAQPEKRLAQEKKPSSSGASPSKGAVGIPYKSSPSIRRLAREQGIDLESLGPQPSSAPLPDFSAYGPIEKKPLSSLRKTAVEVLSRAWTEIPHVTQMDEADVTKLEAWRKAQGKAMQAQGAKLTMSAIVLKFIADLLPEFPGFNASLDVEAGEVIYKKYIHLGVAVDTERGLMVPVIRDVNLNSLAQIAIELRDLSERARNKKLKPDEMQGAGFTLTNLGSLGGTHFTPIIHWPEVAVLGMGRSALRPVWNGQSFDPRLMLPLSLSYDHRLIDGADGIRFLRALIQKLESGFK